MDLMIKISILTYSLFLLVVSYIMLDQFEKLN